MHNTTTPLPTINLHRTAHRQPHPRARKQRLARPTINTQIKVQVRAVLVSSCQPVLRAQRVALRRAQVGDLHDNGPAKALAVARAVG